MPASQRRAPRGVATYSTAASRSLAAAAAPSCGCTDPARVRNGKQTTVFVGDRRMRLCTGCLLDRDNGRVRFMAEDVERAEANRHAEGAIARN